MLNTVAALLLEMVDRKKFCIKYGKIYLHYSRFRLSSDKINNKEKQL